MTNNPNCLKNEPRYHCLHKISEGVKKHVQYEGIYEHWIYMCCECNRIFINTEKINVEYHSDSGAY